MSPVNGITLYGKIREKDDKVMILFITADINSAEVLKKQYPETNNRIIYKPVWLKNLKTKIDSMFQDQ